MAAVLKKLHRGVARCADTKRQRVSVFVSVSDPKVERAERAKQLNADKTLDIDDICKTLRISRSTFYRYLRL